MITLNLTANTKEETLIKEHLEQNASETLADKINNGVYMEKDGLRLLNKKDLAGFMKYACEEARKQTEKTSSTHGLRGACVEDQTVYGWAVHYFEEDSVEGTLYNEDGTEYKPKIKPKPVVPGKEYNPAVTPPPPPKPQISMFDFGESTDTAEKQVETETDIADETDGDMPDDGEFDDTETADAPEKEARYIAQIDETRYVDEDGVVHSDIENRPVNTEIGALALILGSALKAR